MAKLNVKKGDNVIVIAGKDKGKTGKILSVNPSDSTVIVEGVNIIVKHKKAKSAQDKGGIIKKEAKIHSSNVQIIDPTTKIPTRVAHSVIDGKKVRISKKSGAVLDVEYSKKQAKKSEKKSETASAGETVKPVKQAAKPSAKTTKEKITAKTKMTGKEKSESKKTVTTARAKNTPRVRNQER